MPNDQSIPHQRTDDIFGVVSHQAKPEQPRLVTTRPIVGVCYMQVCAKADVSDEEILAHCNHSNPSGTTLGWCHVIREGNGAPVQCADDASRTHFMVGC